MVENLISMLKKGELNFITETLKNKEADKQIYNNTESSKNNVDNGITSKNNSKATKLAEKNNEPVKQCNPKEIFKGKVIFVDVVILGTSKTKYYCEMIEKHGGETRTRVTSQVDFIVFYEGSVNSVGRAVDYGLKLISPLYIEECIDEGRLLDNIDDFKVNVSYTDMKYFADDKNEKNDKKYRKKRTLKEFESEKVKHSVINEKSSKTSKPRKNEQRQSEVELNSEHSMRTSSSTLPKSVVVKNVKYVNLKKPTNNNANEKVKMEMNNTTKTIVSSFKNNKVTDFFFKKLKTGMNEDDILGKVETSEEVNKSENGNNSNNNNHDAEIQVSDNDSIKEKASKTLNKNQIKHQLSHSVNNNNNKNEMMKNKKEDSKLKYKKDENYSLEYDKVVEARIDEEESKNDITETSIANINKNESNLETASKRTLKALQSKYSANISTDYTKSIDTKAFNIFDKAYFESEKKKDELFKKALYTKTQTNTKSIIKENNRGRINPTSKTHYINFAKFRGVSYDVLSTKKKSKLSSMKDSSPISSNMISEIKVNSKPKKNSIFQLMTGQKSNSVYGRPKYL